MARDRGTGLEETVGAYQRKLEDLCCVEAACPDKGKRGHGNLSIRKGKGSGRWRILRCSTCRSEFSERKGTALWGLRMAPSKVENIAAHLKEGCGIRATARLTGASKDGVTSIALRLGLHAHALHDDLAQGLNVSEAQFDEKWSFVNKKQKRCDPSDPEDDAKGDQWDHTALDVSSRFVLSLVVGKRNGDRLKEVVSDFANRTGHTPPALTTSDDCSAYAEVLLEEYGNTVKPPRTGKTGRPPHPFKQWPDGAAYATVNKTYEQGEVTEASRKLVHGTEKDLALALNASSASDKINTSFVERQNGTDRTHNARKARKTCEFSKDLILHIAVSWWVMLCYNFHFMNAGLRQPSGDGTYLHRTPAMVIGLAQRPLTVWELITTQVPGFTPSPKGVPEQWRLGASRGPAP